MAKKKQVNQDVHLGTGEGTLIVSGAEFHQFDVENVFIGIPLGSKVIDDKDGRLMGYNFVDKETGEIVIIGASYSITKSLEKTSIDIDGKKTRYEIIAVE